MTTAFTTELPSLPPARPCDWSELLPHRGYLVQMARRRLADPALAEDVVHDVFEAAVTGRANFGGRSALRTWLVAVLRHKIVDLVRERSGVDSLDAAGPGDDDDASSIEPACPWPGPDEVAGDRQRLQRTLAHIQRLPENLRIAMELRLLQDRDTDDVCRRLAISEENLFVRLHRARHALRALCADAKPSSTTGHRVRAAARAGRSVRVLRERATN